jgi:hypothetical protein
VDEYLALRDCFESKSLSKKTNPKERNIFLKEYSIVSRFMNFHARYCLPALKIESGELSKLIQNLKSYSELFEANMDISKSLSNINSVGDILKQLSSVRQDEYIDRSFVDLLEDIPGEAREFIEIMAHESLCPSEFKRNANRCIRILK